MNTLEFALSQLDCFLFLFSFFIITIFILNIIFPHIQFCFDCMLIIKDEKYERAKNLHMNIATWVVKCGTKNTNFEVKESMVQIMSPWFVGSAIFGNGLTFLESQFPHV